jgi:hypothetical protein
VLKRTVTFETTTEHLNETFLGIGILHKRQELIVTPLTRLALHPNLIVGLESLPKQGTRKRSLRNDWFFCSTRHEQ